MAFEINCFNGYIQYQKRYRKCPSNKLVHISLTIKK